MAYTFLDEEESEAPSGYTFVDENPEPKHPKDKSFSEHFMDSAAMKAARSVGRATLDLATLPALAAYPFEKSNEYIKRGLGFEPSEKTSLGAIEDLRGYLRPEEEEEVIPSAIQRLTRSGPFGIPGIVGDITGLGFKESAKAVGLGEGWQLAADVIGSIFGGNKAATPERIARRVAQSAEQAEQSLSKELPQATNVTRSQLLFKQAHGAEKPVPKPIQLNPKESSHALTEKFGSTVNTLTEQGSPIRLSNKAQPHVLTKVASETIPINPDIKNVNLAQRQVSNLTHEAVDDFGKISKGLGEPNFVDPANFNARDITRNISDTNRAPLLNSLSKVEDEARAWSSVQEAVETGFRKEKESYTKLYNGVRAKVGHIETRPLRSRSALQQIKERINSVKTMPPAYQATGKALESIEHDLGLITAKLDNFTMSMDDSTTIAQLQDLAIRVGDLINYDTIVPTVKNWLKPLQKAIKDDIRIAMKESGNKGALQAWNKAEQAYGHAAERYGADAVKTLRKTETPEAMTALFSTPSNVKKLKSVVSGDALSMAERHIIEKITQGSTEGSLRELAKMRGQLSEKGSRVANELIEMGDKLSSKGAKAATQQGILQDIQGAVINGERPNYAIKLMQTPTGYDLAKETLQKTPQGSKIFKDLEKITMNDFLQSILKPNGEINLDKAKDFIRNPDFRKVFEKIVGRSGVEFLQSLDNKVDKIKSNLHRFEILAQSPQPTRLSAKQAVPISSGQQTLQRAANRASELTEPVSQMNALKEAPKSTISGKGSEKLQAFGRKTNEPSRTEKQAFTTFGKKGTRPGLELTEAQVQRANPVRGKELLERLRPPEVQKVTKEAKEISAKKKVSEYFTPQMKAMFALLGIPFFGKLAVIGVGSYEASRIFYNMLKNPKVRQGINSLASTQGFKPSVILNSEKLIRAGLDEND
jgi:hypothetical protein